MGAHIIIIIAQPGLLSTACRRWLPDSTNSEGPQAKVADVAIHAAAN